MSIYGLESSTKPTVMVPGEFNLVPSLPTMLRTFDLFVAALLEPEAAALPPLPMGAQWGYAAPVRPSAADHRGALYQHLTDWHNQLVTAARYRDENLAAATRAEKQLGEERKTLTLRGQRITALEAELAEQQRLNASQEEELEQQQHQIVTLEAMCKRFGEAGVAAKAAKRAAGRRSSRARKVAR